MKYDTFIVTSNFSPEECYEGQNLAAIRRRFQVEEFRKLKTHDDSNNADPVEAIPAKVWINGLPATLEDLGF